MKGEGNSLVLIASVKSKVTYILEGEDRGEFISPDYMQQIQGHLLAGK